MELAYFSEQFAELRETNRQRYSAIFQEILDQEVGLRLPATVVEQLRTNPFFHGFFQFDEPGLTLRQTIFGELLSHRIFHERFPVEASDEGVILLPTFGYVRVDPCKDSLTCQIDKNGRLSIHSNEVPISFQYSPLVAFAGTHCQLALYGHPLFERITAEAAKLFPNSRVKFREKSEDLLPYINRAFKLIQCVDPSRFSVIAELARVIIPITSTEVLPFTDTRLPGAIFITLGTEFSFTRFVEHLIHESAHIELNEYLTDPAQIFTVNAFETLIDWREQPTSIPDTLYSSLHGGYVISCLIKFYSHWLSSDFYLAEEQSKIAADFMKSKADLVLISAALSRYQRSFTPLGKLLVAHICEASNQLPMDLAV